MKRIFFTLLLSFFLISPSQSYSQNSNENPPCFQGLSNTLQILKEKGNIDPVARGHIGPVDKNSTSEVIFLGGPKKTEEGTKEKPSLNWAFILYNKKTDVACIIALGTQWRPYNIPENSDDSDLGRQSF